ncbi:MAG TPA: type VI secretion system protein TssA [Burkholderiales bacterium]|nr:type VI secretion system protein TssA [Burkholderiales bacterium]
MTTEFEQKTQQYFSEHFGVTLDALLAPIEGPDPGGQNLHGDAVHRNIQEARREDDPTIPMGPWVRELKRANWDQAGDIAVRTLVGKSKDLRLAVWLLEAQLHRHGFAALAPCLTLIDLLCRCHWESLHPRADDGGDLEYRINVIHWVNEKLLPVLRLVPITRTGREREFNWSDWEQAQRLEQVRAQGGKTADAEGVRVLDFSAAMASTSTEWCLDMHAHLSDAFAAVGRLSETLNELCDKDSPSLLAIGGLIEQIQTLAASELHKRGVRFDMAPTDDGDEPQLESTYADTDIVIRDRASAYARLAEAADYLMRIEPHSPVPYLIQRAITWGNLNTAELYQELFVRFGGQLNIFEMLGLQTERNAKSGRGAESG